MPIQLYKHNEEAYHAALSMLAKTRKAAIVHPTGTGKSFIGFKLCEDHPNATICWLSPSEYIFETQLENLAKNSGGYNPDNIRFYTYAKMMLLSIDEIAEIHPDYIILDEFHRCGAEMWGRGVQNLLKAYKDVPVLGLSATSIRYLDNQRDMSDELFDGNVASEMTLGEAIVRGVLNPPKYVLSVFPFQKSLDKYQKRVSKAKCKAVQDEGTKYLEAIRRALDKSEGLDEIFHKHMVERHGKYIVFCSSYEHLCEMVTKVPEWFYKVDQQPHIYSAYSDDPQTSRAFAEFKRDDSDHLKLLFCIDMLNEGIHVDDVDGVILLRPTVSPIIYKQQIGRALSASKKKNAVIFDIVLNIENLYSIGAVEEEMQIATTYYRSLGLEDEIVNEHFQIIDEVRDCRVLFEKLNDTLTASWDLMYTYAEEYFKRNGNLDIPRRYKTHEGYALGNWIHIQRKVRAGEKGGQLDADRIKRLDAIGMIWDNPCDLSWKKYYIEARKYYLEHGHLNTNLNYVTNTGVKLGVWICRMRFYRKNGAQQHYLTEERIQALDSIGMIWDVPDYLWEENFFQAKDFYRQNGNLNIPYDYVAANGIKLNAWIGRQRDIRNGKVIGAKLSDEQIARLDSIGMIWDNKYVVAWQKGIHAAEEYFAEHGNLNVPISYIAKDGYKLGAWISDQREKKDKLSPERRQALDRIGMVWNKPDSWETRFALAKNYFEEHGNLNVPTKYKVNGVCLYKWINEQRQVYIGNRDGKKLTPEQIERLESIGMIWGNRRHISQVSAWFAQYEDAKRFYEANGHLKITEEYAGENGNRLDIWIKHQKEYYRKGKLSKQQIELLSKIGIIWCRDDPWEVGFDHAKSYQENHGDLLVPHMYICEDNYRLGNWISNQRNQYNNLKSKGSLSDERKKRLDDIGMVWNLNEYAWKEGYEHAKSYSMILNGKKWSQSYVSQDGFKTGQWLRTQERMVKKGELNVERKTMLSKIGFDFDIKCVSAYDANLNNVNDGLRQNTI